MEKIKDGGPAFPLVDQRNRSGDITSYAEFGMTLRDYFAAKAMQAMLTHEVNGDWPEHKNVAKHAYDMADQMLMLRAREA